MITSHNLRHDLPAKIQNCKARREVAATLAVTLEEVENTAYRRDLSEVGHFAGVASTVAWDEVNHPGKT